MIEEEYSEEMLEWGRWLFAQECRFMQSVPKPSDLRELLFPEIAFAGRSNVGKSSLINGLTGRLTLARTSNTPGRTQQLNFFCLAEKLILVDMPGYGYAAASKSLVAGWQKLIKIYLRGRSTLYRVYLLIDSRHGLKPNDFEIMKMLDETAVSYQIILTKADKISETAARQVYAKTVEALAKHPAAHPKVILTSAAKGMGIAEVRAEIAQFAHIKV